jgi:hypothetical protein
MSFSQQAFSSVSSAPKLLINVVLILDISQSMDKELEVAKKKLTELSETLIKQQPHAVVSIAVIAYSDYKDDTNYDAHIADPAYWRNNETSACKGCNFTNTTAALKFLNSLKTLHGYDYPEAMELALYKAKTLSWPSAENGNNIIRQVFIVTDSLPHAAGHKHDDFPTVKLIPSALDWSKESQDLKTIGVEFHVLSCSKNPAANTKECYQQLAGKTGSVISLDDADNLISKILEKIQENDAMDNLIGELNTMCVSNKITNNAAIDHLANKIKTVSLMDEAKDIAIAKVEEWKQRQKRHYGFYNKTSLATETKPNNADGVDMEVCSTYTH